jgi:hypothetical protein
MANIYNALVEIVAKFIETVCLPLGMDDNPVDSYHFLDAILPYTPSEDANERQTVCGMARLREHRAHDSFDRRLCSSLL